jgi:hypothetical protein
VPGCPRTPARVRPPSIAIHDDGDVNSGLRLSRLLVPACERMTDVRVLH